MSVTGNPIIFWLCGDSMVKWAAKHALEVVKDVQLGFKEEAELVWMGKSGAYLVDLLPKLPQEIESQQNPTPSSYIVAQTICSL